MKTGKKFIAIPLFLLLLNSNPVWSRVTSHLEEEFRYLESEILVVTPAKISQNISDAPGTIIVITKKQIRERGYTNLMELLEDLPSVDVNNKSTEEFYNHFAFRGNVDMPKFIIMRDSQRVSSPTGEWIPISDNFPLFNAKQVEVVFGPASALYGADAFTGVINIITEDAEEVDGVVISSSIGSFDYYNNYLKFGKELTQNIDITFSGHYQSSNNADLSKYYPEFAPTDLIVSGNTYLSAANREAFTVPTDSYSTYVKLDLYDHFTLGFNQSYFNHPSGSGASRTMALLGEDQKWETLIRNYYGEYNFNKGKKISAKSILSYLTYEVLPGSRYRNLFTNYEIGYKYARSNKFMLEQQVNYDINERHNITGGVSWENFYSLPKTADMDKPFDTGLPANTQNIFYGGTNNTLPMKIFELRYDNIAGYIQAQSEWTDMVSSTVGLRFDHSSRYGNTVNPRGGVIINPAKKTSLELFYGEAYLAPSPYQAYAHYGTFNGTQNANGEYISTFMHLPNPDLKPQKTRSPEINLTQKITPDFIVTLTGYYSWVSNMINDTYYGTSSDFISGGEILAWKRYENKGTAEIYGGDFRADYHTKAGIFDLDFWGNYSFVDGWEDDGSGIRVDLRHIAKHKIKSGLTATFREKYFISPSIRWIGKTNHYKADPNNPTKRLQIDAYTLVNLHSGINNLFGGLSVYLTVRNLFDNRYYNAGASSLVSSPQDPRKFIGTLEYKF